MKLVVGLGNIGEEYVKTRHNLGFMVVEKILKDNTKLEKTFWTENKPLKSWVAKLKIKGHDIVLAKPLTFMNNSGWAAKLLLEKNNFSPRELVLIHDDVDLPLGKIKVRFGGASAGHRGVQSVIESLGTDKFLRVRMGIGRPGKFSISNFKSDSIGFKFQISNKGVEDYVLDDFTSNETGKVRTMLSEASKIVEILVKEGIEKYMSKYNK